MKNNKIKIRAMTKRFMRAWHKCRSVNRPTADDAEIALAIFVSHWLFANRKNHRAFLVLVDKFVQQIDLSMTERSKSNAGS